MDEWVRKPGNSYISGERNPLARKIYDQITARVRRCEMEQLEADTIYSERFFSIYGFRRKVVVQVDILRIAARVLHLLLAVFLSNDGQALGESGQAVDMVEIAMSEDHMRHGFRRELSDFL